jgi:hypothetical protein
MTRPGLCAALAVLAWTAGPLASSAHAQQICPWGMQILMQQQAAQARIQQMQQQQQALAKTQAMINQYKPPAPQPQQAKAFIPPMVPRAAPPTKPAKNNPPAKGPNPAPAKKAPKGEGGGKVPTGEMTHVNRLEVAVPVFHHHTFPTAGDGGGGGGGLGGSGGPGNQAKVACGCGTMHVNRLEVGIPYFGGGYCGGNGISYSPNFGGGGSAVGNSGSATNTKNTTAKQPGSNANQSMTGMMSGPGATAKPRLNPPAHNPPIKAKAPPIKKPVAKAPQVKLPVQPPHGKLILDAPAPLAKPEPDAKAKAKPKPPQADQAAKPDGNPPPLVKLQFTCVQCHIKMKVNLNDPVHGQKPPPLPMIVQAPKPNHPLQMPIDPRPAPLLRCPHQPPANLQHPIAAMPAPRPLHGIQKDPPGPEFANPRNKPIIGPANPSLARQLVPNGPPQLPNPISGPPSLANGIRAPSSQGGVVSSKGDRSGTIPADPITSGTSPMSDGQSPGDMLLLNPLGEPNSRTGREPNGVTSAPLPKPSNPDAVPAIDLSGPTLPPLPPFVLILPPVAPWNGERRDNDWYAPQLAQRQARATSQAPLDLSRPNLPPLAPGILLPN